MKLLKSKIGWTLSAAYILISVFLILSQGLFGESFIALILGLPWVLIPAKFEGFGASSPFVMYAVLLLPIILNAILLYIIGFLIERKRTTAVLTVIFGLLLGGISIWYLIFISIDHSQYIEGVTIN